MGVKPVNGGWNKNGKNSGKEEEGGQGSGQGGITSAAAVSQKSVADCFLMLAPWNWR